MSVQTQKHLRRQIFCRLYQADLKIDKPVDTLDVLIVYLAEILIDFLHVYKNVLPHRIGQTPLKVNVLGFSTVIPQFLANLIKNLIPLPLSDNEMLVKQVI